MTETVISINGIAVRFTDERWAHIAEEHCELAGMRFDVLETAAQPDKIYEGGEEENLAVRKIEAGKYLVAIYRETESDEFIITAFLTRRINYLEKRKPLWSQQK